MKIADIELGEKPLLLAPMEDVTDPSFRYMCKRFGADVVYTEFISSDGLIRDAAKSLKKLEIDAAERPVGIQLYGHLIEPMVEAARMAEAAGPDEGLALVNEIRRRAGIPELPECMSLAEFRKAVIQERALELAFEGNRLYDLRRTASVTATVPEATKLSEEQAAFYPIPQRELDLNPNVK